MDEEGEMIQGNLRTHLLSADFFDAATNPEAKFEITGTEPFTATATDTSVVAGANTKISGNEVLWKIVEHPSYNQALKEDKPHLTNDPELTRKIYTELSSSDKYQQYITAQSRDKKEEKDKNKEKNQKK
jgi:hypothetical protein